MQELWNTALAAVNLPYTILLGFVLLYWLSVIAGIMDMSAGEIDIDVDIDADADLEGDVGGISSALHFFNFGKVPFMLIMTVVILAAWSMALISNDYWGNYEWPFALAMVGPILFISLFIAKLLTTPVIPFFEQLNKSAAPVEFIGQNCIVLLPADNEKFGQAEVRIDGDVLLINVKPNTPNKTIQKGEKAVVIGQTPDKKHYLIETINE